jgi:NADH-quinone oxidoreductase subunit A
MLGEYLPVLLQILVAILFAASALSVSVLVGKSGKRTPAKDTAYECGMIPQGERQPRFSVKFYLVAMLFILFDLEIVFMYPWAVVYREMIVESKLVLWSMLSFISILMVGYIYALKKGALDWKR